MSLVEEDTLDKSIRLIDQILQANYNTDSLGILQIQAVSEEPGEFSLEDRLLLYLSQLVVPKVDNLYILLIKEAYTQISTVYSSRDKTYYLLQLYYYWPRIQANIDHYIQNYYDYYKSYVPRDKTPGYLYLLPIPEKPQRYISVDFKSALKDKSGFDNICIIIDQLSKQSISVLYYKTVTAEQLVQLFISYIYYYYSPSDSIVSDHSP